MPTDFYSKPNTKEVLARVADYRLFLDWLRWSPGVWIRADFEIRSSPLAMEEEAGNIYGNSDDFVCRHFFEEPQPEHLAPQQAMWFKYNGVAPDGPAPDLPDRLAYTIKTPMHKPYKNQEKLSHIAYVLGAARFMAGEWVKITNAKTSAATLIRKGLAYNCQEGEFAATGRVLPGSPRTVVDLYVMYVGAINYGLSDLDSDHVSKETPYHSKSPRSGDKQALRATALRSKPTTWIQDVVRPAAGRWVEYPGTFHAKIPVRIRRGDAYTARKREFDIELVTINGVQTMRARVNPEWIEFEKAGNIELFMEVADEIESSWKGSVADWITYNKFKQARTYEEVEEVVQEFQEATPVHVPEVFPDSNSVDDPFFGNDELISWLEEVMETDDWVDFPGPALPPWLLREVADGAGNTEGCLFDVFNAINDDGVEVTRARVLPTEED